METKLNIAEILKDKPKGTKLYDLLININVKLDNISTTDIDTVVWCMDKTDNTTTRLCCYSEFGTVRGCPDGLQILKPSKEMRDWSKFAWKKGDVLKNTAYEGRVIFDRFLNDDYTYFVAKHPLDSSNKDKVIYHEECNCFTGNYCLESTNAAQAYINAIEEKLGGKLNMATLEIEPTQSEFKDGDIVTATSDFDSIFIGVLKKNIKDFPNNELRFYCALENKKQLVFDGLEVAIKAIKTSLATEKEKQLLFAALAMGGKAWDAEKKEIVDLKIKVEFKPFDRVLVRDCLDEMWRPSFLACYLPFCREPYQVIGGEWVKLCIPYEGNESLLGTTKDVKG